MVKASTHTPDIDFKVHKIVADGDFWFPESGEKNRRCKKYGITPEMYNKFFTKQEGCCAICGVHQSELSYTLCIDHDHTTGIVRGLLCHRCNTGIGRFEDKAELLEKAIYYLNLSQN
jgi:hypothetical protein